MAADKVWTFSVFTELFVTFFGFLNYLTVFGFFKKLFDVFGISLYTGNDFCMDFRLNVFTQNIDFKITFLYTIHLLQFLIFEYLITNIF